jgi:hypothetical protein
MASYLFLITGCEKEGTDPPLKTGVPVNPLV